MSVDRVGADGLGGLGGADDVSFTVSEVGKEENESENVGASEPQVSTVLLWVRWKAVVSGGENVVCEAVGDTELGGAGWAVGTCADGKLFNSAMSVVDHVSDAVAVCTPVRVGMVCFDVSALG